jgi:hypothetical protein
MACCPFQPRGRDAGRHALGRQHPILAEQYGADNRSLPVFFLSTVLSLFTVPGITPVD